MNSLSVKERVNAARYLNDAADLYRVRAQELDGKGDSFGAQQQHAQANEARKLAALILAQRPAPKAVPAGGNGLTIGEERAPAWHHVELSVTVDGRPQLYEVVSAGYLAAANSSDTEVVRVIRAVATGEGEEGSIGGGAGPLTTIRKAVR